MSLPLPDDQPLDSLRVMLGLLSAAAVLVGVLWRRMIASACPPVRRSGPLPAPRFPVLADGQMLLPGVSESRGCERPARSG